MVMKLPKDKTGTPALRPANDDSYRQIHHTPFDGEFLEFFEHWTVLKLIINSLINQFFEN